MEHTIHNAQSHRQPVALAQTEQAPWGQSLLAGLPHLIYALSVYGFQLLPLQSYRIRDGYLILPFNIVFWLIVLIGLAFAWRAGWLRWSATWIGYGVLLFVELLLVLPTSGSSTNEGLAILSGVFWILLAVGILVWTTRRDWLDGFLAVLPVMPMWYTFLALDGVAGNEAPLFYAIGLFIATIVMWTVRQGNPFKGLGWILVAVILIGLTVSYATVYFSNFRPPVGSPPTPSPGAVISALVVFLLGYVVLSCPVWVTAIVRCRKNH